MATLSAGGCEPCPVLGPEATAGSPRPVRSPPGGRAPLQTRRPERLGAGDWGLGEGSRARGPRRGAQLRLLLQPGGRGTGGRRGATLTLEPAGAAGRRPAAQTEPAQGGPAPSVGRSGGGQARQHPGGAEAPTRTASPAAAPPAAPADSIDRVPASDDACAAAGGLGDPEVATSFMNAGAGAADVTSRGARIARF